jgi:hypothetical protein
LWVNIFADKLEEMMFSRRKLLNLFRVSAAAFLCADFVVRYDILQVVLNYPPSISEDDLNIHLAKVQKIKPLSILLDFYKQNGRMIFIDETREEGTLRWTYKVKSVEDFKEFRGVVRRYGLVDYNYMGGAFTWTSTINGQVISANS